MAVIGNQWSTTGAVTGDRVRSQPFSVPTDQKQGSSSGGGEGVKAVREKGFHALISVFPCRGHKTVIPEGGGKVKGGRLCGGGGADKMAREGRGAD